MDTRKGGFGKYLEGRINRTHSGCTWRGEEEGHIKDDSEIWNLSSWYHVSSCWQWVREDMSGRANILDVSSLCYIVSQWQCQVWTGYLSLRLKGEI